MKKLNVLLLTAVAAFALTACGEKEPEQTNGTQPPAVENEANGGDEGAASETVKGYTFEYEGVVLGIDALAAPLVEKLGEPVSYFEAASCAFEGLDKMYTYNSVEIDTYPAEDGDRISSILFKDDMVETAEGVSLFETKADILAAYGENFIGGEGSLVYEKDGMELRFILEGDEIVSIEYAAVLF